MQTWVALVDELGCFGELEFQPPIRYLITELQEFGFAFEMVICHSVSVKEKHTNETSHKQGRRKA